MAGRYYRPRCGKWHEWVGLAEQLSRNRAAASSAVRLAGAISCPSRHLSTRDCTVCSSWGRGLETTCVSLAGIDSIAVNSLMETLRECRVVNCHHQVTAAKMQSQDLNREGAHGGLCEVSEVCGRRDCVGCVVTGAPAASSGNLRYVNTYTVPASLQSWCKSTE